MLQRRSPLTAAPGQAEPRRGPTKAAGNRGTTGRCAGGAEPGLRQPSPPRGSAPTAACFTQSQAASRNRAAAASPPLSESEPEPGPEPPLGAAILRRLRPRGVLGAVVLPRRTGRPRGMLGAVVLQGAARQDGGAGTPPLRKPFLRSSEPYSPGTKA